MTPESMDLELLRDRLRILEKENELLTERAEDITLLGLVAERAETCAEPVELVAALLEQVCILKALPYGAWLESDGAGLRSLTAYHLRRPETDPPDQFSLRGPGPWPPAGPVILAPEVLECHLEGPAFTPTALLLVPLRCGLNPKGCLLFADEVRSPEAVAPLAPLLGRVAALARARLENLFLIEELRRLNLGLDQEVAARTVELRRSEERYRTLFDHVPDGVLLLNREDLLTFGRIEDANEGAATMHGYTLEELRGMDILALNTDGQSARLETFDARVWGLTPGMSTQAELIHRRKDGSAFPVESRCSRIEIHGRDYILVFTRDLTERKRAEQALLLTQRVESIGVLAGGIAHDFNNLLTAIMGQTHIAMDLAEGSGPVQDHLEKALNAADRAAALTRQMLAYAGRVQFLVQPVALNELVQENLRFLQAAIPKQIQFDLELEEGLPTVTADPAQLQQVIMNLVINGVEAIGQEPGRITIRSRAVCLEEADGVRWPLPGERLPAGDYVWLEVADTGCGMSPEVLAKVFEPFFSTKAKGHGLGLAAVQGIIRGHRGGLGVDSAPGLGTTFRILLPAGALALPLPERAEEPSPSTRRRVLVIDDEDYMREVIQDNLEAHGHDSLLAQSGEEGLALFVEQGAGIDLVLLDLNMPGLGGAETFARLRALSPGIPVILSSGFAPEEVLAALGPLKPSGFLQKPYRARDLVRMVEAMAR